MKLNSLFRCGETRIALTSDTWVLEENNAGRAIAVACSDTPLEGECTFAIGYDDQLERYFTGFITESIQLDRRQQKLTIREKAAALAPRRALSRRNVIARDVLADLAELTGLAFITGDNPEWLEQSTPHYINNGTGYDLLDAFGRIYRIPNYAWIPQADGSVYVGDYSNSEVAKNILKMPQQFFTELSATGASCAVVPAFRPGRRLRIGNSRVLRIREVTLSGNSMRIQFA